MNASLAGYIAGNTHFLPVRVYYEDTDFSGYVYHASYLRFMERGRTDHIRLLGLEQGGLFSQGLAFVVRDMNIRFHAPARMDDILIIETLPRDVRGASLLLAQRVMRDQNCLVEAQVKVACVMGGRAKRIPEMIRERMSAYD